MPFVRIRDYDMYYEEQGTGDPLLLLHGGTGSIAEWASALPVYARHYRVIANDRWGYGKSSDRLGFLPDYHRQDATDCSAFLGALGVTRAHVMGYSDGGSIALLMAAQQPALVRSLVLYGAHSHWEESMGVELRRMHEHDLRLADLEQRMRERNFKRNRVMGAWWSTGSAKLDIRPEIAQVRCPALVIQGMNDQYVGPAHAEGIAQRIPGAQLWLIPKTDHALRRPEPEAFDARVLDFLARH
jgi:pimeloyl-ACP methyl ester carboxylesterase